MAEAVVVLRIGCSSPKGFKMASHTRDARTQKVNFPRVEKKILFANQCYHRTYSFIIPQKLYLRPYEQVPGPIVMGLTVSLPHQTYPQTR